MFGYLRCSRRFFLFNMGNDLWKSGSMQFVRCERISSIFPRYICGEINFIVKCSKNYNNKSETYDFNFDCRNDECDNAIRLCSRFNCMV